MTYGRTLAITVDVNSDTATAPKPKRTALFHDTSSQQWHPPYTFVAAVIDRQSTQSLHLTPGCLAVSHEISHSNPLTIFLDLASLRALTSYLYLRTHRTLECQGPVVSRHILSTMDPLAHITFDANPDATAAHSPRRKALFHDTSSQQLHPPSGCLAVSGEIIYSTLSPYEANSTHNL